MEKDLISVIIPVYNAENFIQETIATIKEQTYRNFEAIFVEDKSTDNSKNILKRNLDNRMMLIELEQNVGPAMARNKGLEIAKGRYIAYLDADDRWEKNKLEIQYKFMKENDYAFSYTSYRLMNQKGEFRKSVKIHEKLNYIEALKKIRVLTSTSMFDLNKIDKNLLFMPNLKNAQDVATWYKILKKGYIAYGINNPLTDYRNHKNANSSNKLKSMHGRWLVYRKEEKLSLTKSLYYFINYIINALFRRI